MANIVLIVLNTLFFYIIFCVSGVLTRDCSEMDKIKSCDECIRCGGNWCNRPNKQEKHCSDVTYDNWCPSHRETLPSSERKTLKGQAIDPIYVQRTVFIHEPSELLFTYSRAGEPQVEVIANTSQNADDVALSHVTSCAEGTCETRLHVIPGTEFCLSNATLKTSLSVKVSFENVTEEALLNYDVPCACNCSSVVEKHAPVCNGRGSLSCGVCTCEEGWVGEFCEEKVCKSNRGDLQCSNPAKIDVECSGNGFCDSCQTCECFTDREGSQYFDKEYFCADICMTTSDCEECLKNPNPGHAPRECEECLSPLTVMDRYNSSLMGLRDEFNRKVWVRCNKTLPDECYVEYAAMKDEYGTIHMMVISLCPAVVAGVTGPINVTIPIALGIIGMIAAVATAAGFMMYKKSTPPLPLTDPQYQNIDAEDCVGENPLYKPPTSSFKNPTYGKW